MKDITLEEAKKYPKSGRINIKGYYSSSDGLVQGMGESGRQFVENYEQASKEDELKTKEWVAKLRSLGVKASHPDDGWHKREEKYFGISYPEFNDGIKVGDMVALGNYNKFVIVIVDKISGILSTRYHYKSTIY